MLLKDVKKDERIFDVLIIDVLIGCAIHVQISDY